MSNVLTVNLHAKGIHVSVQVQVQEQDGSTYSLAVRVNGKIKLGPKGKFATPQEALEYTLARYNQEYPFSGVYVEAGENALNEGAAVDFLKGLEYKEFKQFEKFLKDLNGGYSIVATNEAEYHKAHTIWANGGAVLDAAVAINKLRNGLTPSR